MKLKVINTTIVIVATLFSLALVKGIFWLTNTQEQGLALTFTAIIAASLSNELTSRFGTATSTKQS